MKNSLGAFRDLGSGSGGILRAQWMCEYNPIIRRFQGRGDLRLLLWVQTVPIYNDWTVTEHPPRNLRSSSCIGKEGRGRETSPANVGFSSKKFGSLARTCHEKDL